MTKRQLAQLQQDIAQLRYHAEQTISYADRARIALEQFSAPAPAASRSAKVVKLTHEQQDAIRMKLRRGIKKTAQR